MFIAALFTMATTWKPPKCPPAEEGLKMRYIYVYTIECYSATKKRASKVLKCKTK